MTAGRRSGAEPVAAPNRILRAFSAEAVCGLLLAAGTALLLVVAYQPREVTFFSQAADNMYWPRRILWPLLFLCLFVSIQAMARAVKRTDGGTDNMQATDRSHLVRPVLLMGACALGLFLIDVIGFIPLTFLFASGIPLLLGPIRLRDALIFATVVTTVIWTLFIQLLAVPLPRGIGVFRQLSFLFQ